MLRGLLKAAREAAFAVALEIDVALGAEPGDEALELEDDDEEEDEDDLPEISALLASHDITVPPPELGRYHVKKCGARCHLMVVAHVGIDHSEHGDSVAMGGALSACLSTGEDEAEEAEGDYLLTSASATLDPIERTIMVRMLYSRQDA